MLIPEILFSLGFGVRSLTFEDFEKACAVMNFKYFLVDEKIGEGFSYPRTRKGIRHRVIILERTLFLHTLTEVAWHEFCHAANEHYGVRCFVRGSEDKAESEAIDFSVVCMIPTLWVRTKTREELYDEGFTKDQVDRRYYIYEKSDKKL